MSGRAERARRALMRPGAWLSAESEGYALRQGDDRRARVILRIDEDDFLALVRSPGLKVRAGDGWVLNSAGRGERQGIAHQIGRPGLVESRCRVVGADGRITEAKINLARSAVDWLAARADAEGKPLLTRRQKAAADRLSADWEMASRGVKLTGRWDGLPSRGAGGGASQAPGGGALAAARRVERALSRLEVRDRALVRAVCLDLTALEAAERRLGLGRRQGRLRLAEALEILADGY